MDEKQVISVIPYAGGGDLLADARTIIDSARQYAYSAVNMALVQRNWLLGKRISAEELKANGRANYGLEIIKNLSRKLTDEYGKGFSGTDLYWCVRLYKAYPEIFASVSKNSLPSLSWTHYRVLLQVEDTKARDWYMHEASAQTWSVRTLQRNMLSRTFLMMHFIGIQTFIICILSEFSNSFSAFYRNSDILTIFVSTIYEKK